MLAGKEIGKQVCAYGLNERTTDEQRGRLVDA